MADQYDAYRLQQQTPSNPWALQGDPQQFYAPSSSIWGNLRDRGYEGSQVTGGMPFGLAGMATGGMLPESVQKPFGQASYWGSGGPLSGAGMLSMGLGSFWNGMGGMGALKSGEMFKNLGNADNWRNVATFGVSGAKDAQEEAKNARKQAVWKWRDEQCQRLGGLLAQQGADVQADLGPELDAALRAGGDMGDMDAIKNAMAKFETRANQYLMRRGQAGQARQVDAMFSDPRRVADRNKRLGQERTRAFGDLAEQYRMGQRNNSFNQARRGMQGSSVDVEQQGQMQRGRDRTAGAIQSGLDEKARAYRLGDAAQQNALKGMIYADDPNMAAGFQRSLEAINNQGKLIQEQAAARSQMTALSSATSQGYSQAIGGALTGLSQPLGYYAEHQGGGA